MPLGVSTRGPRPQFYPPSRGYPQEAVLGSPELPQSCFPRRGQQRRQKPGNLLSRSEQLQRRRLPHNLTIRPLCCPAANCWAAPGSSAFALWGLQLSWTGGSRAMEPWENQGGTTSCPSFEGTACKACEQWAGTAARTPEPAPSFLFSGGTLRCTIWRRNSDQS